MRTVSCEIPRPAAGQEERVARLVRHLEARLRDFGPGGPEVLEADQVNGRVTARVPGHDTAQVLAQLREKYGIAAAQSGDRAIFFLGPELPFEDLDYVWGCLFEVL